MTLEKIEELNEKLKQLSNNHHIDTQSTKLIIKNIMKRIRKEELKVYKPTDYYELNKNLEIQTNLTTLPNEVVYTKDMLDTLSIIKQSNISIDIKAKLIDDLNKKALINYLDNIYAICLYKLYPEREISNKTIKACIDYGTLDLTKLEDVIDIYKKDDKYIVRIIEPFNDTWIAWRTDIIHSDKIKTVFALTNKTINILSHKKQYHLWTALNTETAIKPEKQECCKIIKQEVQTDYTVTEFTTFTHHKSLNKKVFAHSKELLGKRLMSLYDLETSRPSRNSNKHTQKLLETNVLNIKPQIEDSKIVQDNIKKDFYTLSLYDPYYDIIYKMTPSKKHIEKHIDIDKYNTTNNIAYKINVIMNILLDPIIRQPNQIYFK